jgi:dUTP pyrophosphatase
MKVKVIEGGRAPERKTPGSAGLDCYVRESVRIMPYHTQKIPLGFACAIPEGHVGLLVLRSGVGLRGTMVVPNGVGIIDSDYRGEVCAIVQTGENAVSVQAGERIAQMVIVPYAAVDVEVVDELGATVRGEGGFGSTGG